MSDKHAIFAEEHHERGWLAKIKLPNRSVEIVKGRGGDIEYYGSYAEAMAVAGVTLCARLNGARGPQIFLPKKRREATVEANRVFANFK